MNPLRKNLQILSTILLAAPTSSDIVLRKFLEFWFLKNTRRSDSEFFYLVRRNIFLAVYSIHDSVSTLPVWYCLMKSL